MTCRLLPLTTPPAAAGAARRVPWPNADLWTDLHLPLLRTAAGPAVIRQSPSRPRSTALAVQQCQATPY
jgi:hypothetical protein